MTTGMFFLGTCPQCGETQLEVVRKVSASGSEMVGAWCGDCQRWGRVRDQKGVWISKSAFEFCYDRLRIVTDDTPPRECCVAGCGNTDCEEHHFAPRALFGNEECERWPKHFLCHAHHEMWHAILRTPNAKAPKQHAPTLEYDLHDAGIG